MIDDHIEDTHRAVDQHRFMHGMPAHPGPLPIEQAHVVIEAPASRLPAPELPLTAPQLVAGMHGGLQSLLQAQTRVRVQRFVRVTKQDPTRSEERRVGKEWSRTFRSRW